MSSLPILFFDIDNTIAQSDAAIRAVISAYTEGRVRLEYEDIRCFDYHKCRDANGQGIDSGEWHAVHNDFADPAIIKSIEPMDHAVDQLWRLREHYQLHAMTTRLPAARIPTIEWLDACGFPTCDLHFLRHGKKHESLSHYRATAVEDHYEQAVAFAAAGTTCYLLRHPWNRSCPPRDGVVWVADWLELGEILAGDRA